MNELEEFRNDAYSSAQIYKEKSKKWHDSRIFQRTFSPGQKVLLFNSRLHLFPGKLRSKWTGPYTIEKVFPYGTVELMNQASRTTFKVNGARLKHFHEDFSQQDLSWVENFLLTKIE